MKTALALRHVGFEDLGLLAAGLADRGYQVETVEVPSAGLSLARSRDWDLVVVLGGPLSVNDGQLFPFLEEERTLLQARLRADRPTLGICLGAQLMAQALGARVYAGAEKEIGWGPLELTAAGARHPLRHLGKNPVLHWHGETFDLPAGATLLASTAVCTNQAFSVGRAGLALQFHPEVTASGLERWYVGHIVELSAAGVSIPDLRAASLRHAEPLTGPALAFLDAWLTAIEAVPADGR
jgi:GMP synthase (glutamine-hydrolysing)